jgi:gamma-glutamyltranspeptidase / glutathione hydrolase
MKRDYRPWSLLFIIAISSIPVAHADSPVPVKAKTSAVATDHELATKAAVEVLQAGGNAADAAVAAAFALGVINPTSSGIGGGGFAVVYSAKDQTSKVYDFREMAPAALDPSDYLVNGKPDMTLSRKGGLSVGVPGEVAGLFMLSKQHGVLPWRKVVAPAERLARRGFAASAFFARAAGLVAPGLKGTPAFASLQEFLQPGGMPIVAGNKIKRVALANTLRAIQKQGANGYYQGAVAKDLVATINADGGNTTLQDFQNYQVMERTPLTGYWNNLQLVTMPLPSSGGLVLLETLGILDSVKLDASKTPVTPADRMHLLVEALKHSFADRARWLGDSANAVENAKSMMDPARLLRLSNRIDVTKTLAPEQYGGSGKVTNGKADDHGTSHLCVIDSQGNAVALTSTVNGYFGSKMMSKTGVVLNNQMDDFAIAADTPNQFGLTQSKENLVGGGKRPLSSMTPTLLIDKDGAVRGCVGGSGGPLIISGTIQVIINAFELGMNSKDAVTAPRIHHQWKPNELLMQQSPDDPLVAEMKKRGHVVSTQAGEAIVQLIKVNPDSLEPASDPDKGGDAAAAVVKK